jgi:hypothetical protein
LSSVGSLSRSLWSIGSRSRYSSSIGSCFWSFLSIR